MIDSFRNTKTKPDIVSKAMRQRKLSFATNILAGSEQAPTAFDSTPCKIGLESFTRFSPSPDLRKMMCDTSSPALTQKPEMLLENENSIPTPVESHCYSPITPISTPLSRHSAFPGFLSLYDASKSQLPPCTPQKPSHRRKSYTGIENSSALRKAASRSACKSRISNKLRRIQPDKHEGIRGNQTFSSAKDNVMQVSPISVPAMSQSFINTPAYSQSFVNTPVDCYSQSYSQFTQPINFHQTGYYVEFQEISVLGCGNFGKVYAVERKLDRLHFAIKQVPILSNASALRAKCIQEIQTMSIAGKGKHVVQLHHAWIEGENAKQTVYFLMELCSGGNMHNRLRKLTQACSVNSSESMNAVNIDPHFSELEILDILGQCTLALYSCHSQYIAHCDVKLENILYDGKGRLKLADFGLALRMDLNSGKEAPTVGSAASVEPSSLPNGDVKGVFTQDDGDARYISLDMLNERVHFYEGDIFALGMCMYELMVGIFLPKNGQEHTDLRTTDLILRRLSEKRIYRQDIVELVYRMVSFEPKSRPDALQILHADIFNVIKNEVIHHSKSYSAKEASFLCTVSEIEMVMYEQSLHQMLG